MSSHSMDAARLGRRNSSRSAWSSGARSGATSRSSSAVPKGHAETVRARADEAWSLGALTLPHMLVRLVVAEQLYRAAALLANHPYHRA